jgi:hypothetical protein
LIDGCPTGCSPACPPEVRVTWTIDASDSELGGFQIYRAESAAATGQVIASVDRSERCLVDGDLPGVDGLDEGGVYWYRVRALSPSGIPGFRSAPDSAIAPACQ